jgi:hypothetical protein
MLLKEYILTTIGLSITHPWTILLGLRPIIKNLMIWLILTLSLYLWVRPKSIYRTDFSLTTRWTLHQLNGKQSQANGTTSHGTIPMGGTKVSVSGGSREILQNVKMANT